MCLRRTLAVSAKVPVHSARNYSEFARCEIIPKIRNTNVRTVCLPLSFVSVTMTTTRVLSLLQILLMSALCRANSLDPDLLAETSPSAAALTQTQGPAKVTLSVTYHRNQTGHLVAQVKFCLLRNANSHEWRGEGSDWEVTVYASPA
jgi:hypothetical protein